MGDRVAVIKDGFLQQVESPEELYANPDNVFVAAFIGSPSMNLYEGVLRAAGDGYELALGDQTLAVPASVASGRPKLADYLDQPLVVGVRPEDLEDAAVVPEHPADERLQVSVDVREALGAETLVHFALKAPSVDSGDPDALDELGSDDEARCTGRFSPMSRARVGDHIEVAVNTARLHFFDKASHLAIRA